MYEWLKEPQIAWFLFGLLLFLGELVTPGIMFLFFGFGAWTVVAFLLTTALSPALQFSVFSISSLLYLYLFRAKLLTLFDNKIFQFDNFPSTLQDDVIGREVEVAESITPPSVGRVFLNGTLWLAKAHEPIAAGRVVRIIKQDALILTVEAVEQRD